jgi:adenylyltransferase/sulfurtransferase
MSLSDAELERYARQIVLPQLGGVGQQKLQRSSVVLIGAGAIGTAALAALAGAGVGRISIVDPDAVEASNLHRQFIYRDDQVGAGKAEAAAKWSRALNPHVEVVGIAERIEAENVDAIIGDHDLILDGSDNFATRLSVGDASVRRRIPLVSAAAAQLQAQVSLLRGWEAGQPCYRCFVGDAFDTDDCDNCAELGVIGALAASAAHFAALLAIREHAGIGADAAGRLHVLDGFALRCRSISLPKTNECRGCGGTHATAS